MDNYNDQQSGGYFGLFVTLLSAAGAVYHFFLAHKSDASFALGTVATVVAVVAGIMTIREKWYSIKVHKQNLKK